MRRALLWPGGWPCGLVRVLRGIILTQEGFNQRLGVNQAKVTRQIPGLCLRQRREQKQAKESKEARCEDHGQPVMSAATNGCRTANVNAPRSAARHPGLLKGGHPVMDRQRRAQHPKRHRRA